MKTSAFYLSVRLAALLMPVLPGCRTVPIPYPNSLAEGRFKWGVALDGYPIASDRLEKVEQETGVAADLVVFFMAWPEHGHLPAVFPFETLNAIHDHGAIPCLTWEPMYFKDGDEHAISARAILSGEYDAYISSFARHAARWNKRMIIRFAHEMNLARYHWGGTAEEYGPDSPGLYKQMFRYVVKRFREYGANNVLWAFNPNAESVPQEAWNNIAAYYPGCDFVDLLGIDGYNWGATQNIQQHGWNSRWQTFEQIFGAAHSELRALDDSKPLFIFETSSVCAGGEQSLWLADALETSRDWNIDGMVWFHADKENDWRLQADSARVLRNFIKNKNATTIE